LWVQVLNVQEAVLIGQQRPGWINEQQHLKPPRWCIEIAQASVGVAPLLSLLSSSLIERQVTMHKPVTSRAKRL
jgi:hypothetical protein